MAGARDPAQESPMALGDPPKTEKRASNAVPVEQLEKSIRVRLDARLKSAPVSHWRTLRIEQVKPFFKIYREDRRVHHHRALPESLHERLHIFKATCASASRL
jgi:hypothetical protein